VTSFYSALKAELERVERADLAVFQAVRDEAGRVDESNWRDQLDALKVEHGTWKGVAEALGTDKRTIERWRHGYAPRGGGPRRFVNPAGFIPKIRAAVGQALPPVPKAGDRRRQVSLVDWKRLRVTGTVVFPPPPDKEAYRRHENMWFGRYFTAQQAEGIAAAYIARNPARVQAAVDYAISTEYLGFDAHLIDVEQLSFN
jgi:hypothetical protein